MNFLLALPSMIGKALGTLSFWQIVSLALGLFFAVQHFELIHSRHEAAKWHTLYTREHAGRLADRETYAKAQADAQALNIVQVARVKLEQQRISDERLQDANDRLARLAGELRAHGPAAQSHPASPATPALPGGTAGVDGATCVLLSPDQLLRAAQDEERHAQLIEWVTQQSALDPNK